MKLYKNVDICDLEKILKEGILPISKTGNNNWDDGKRANNSEDCVYLFEATGTQNSFPIYGVALLEVETEAQQSEIPKNDSHCNMYNEYTTNEVTPEHITRVMIPEIFRSRTDLQKDILQKIQWVEMEANYYQNFQLLRATDEIMNEFAATAEFESTESFNFFRGTHNSEILDLMDIVYKY